MFLAYKPISIIKPFVPFLRPNIKMLVYTTALEGLSDNLIRDGIPECMKNIDNWVIDAVRFGWQGIIDMCRKSNPCKHIDEEV